MVYEGTRIFCNNKNSLSIVLVETAPQIAASILGLYFSRQENHKKRKMAATVQLKGET